MCRDQLELEDAKKHLEQAGLVVSLTGKSYYQIRGGVKKAIDPDGVSYVTDPFAIHLEGQFWFAIFIGPYQGTTIIYMSNQLKEVVIAVETFFSLYEKQLVNYQEFVQTLSELQSRGLIAMIDPLSLETFAINVFCAGESKGDNPNEFMLQNAHLLETETAYRIYPHPGQWFIESPSSTDKSPLKVVPNLGEAAEILTDLCGRR